MRWDDVYLGQSRWISIIKSATKPTTFGPMLKYQEYEWHRHGCFVNNDNSPYVLLIRRFGVQRFGNQLADRTWWVHVSHMCVCVFGAVEMLLGWRMESDEPMNWVEIHTPIDVYSFVRGWQPWRREKLFFLFLCSTYVFNSFSRQLEKVIVVDWMFQQNFITLMIFYKSYILYHKINHTRNNVY